MNVLSLFDGISCGQVALQRTGINVKNYYASEIDKYAISITQKNYPNTIQLGDIQYWKKWSIDFSSIDLLIGGSPCQDLSITGKGKGLDGERSGLFYCYVDILNHIKKLNPSVKFLLENVVMKKEHELIMSRLLGIEPIKINSALVSAQNRERLYWTNIYTKEVGLFGEHECQIPQPKNKGILLKDILQHKVDKKYFISQKHQDSYNKNEAFAEKLIYEIIEVIKLDRNLKPKPNQNKASCLTGGGNSGGNHSDMDLICVRDGVVGKGSQGARVYSINYKGITLSACGGGMGAKTGLYNINSKVRRLTPIECERLQTLPDNYTQGVSDTQRYKALGNGWTVDVIVHIFNYLRVKT